MKKLFIRECIELINKGGKLVYYWKTCTPVIKFGGEHPVDQRSYLGLLSRGYKPQIIGYQERIWSNDDA